MREVFQKELGQLKELLVVTSKEVSYAIQGATGAFATFDVPLAESVIAHDDAIDRLTADLDELSITILVKQAPVARDLRIVVSALRISANLERMGDLAAHIAKIVTLLEKPLDHTPEVTDAFAQLSESVLDLAEQVTRLLETEDSAIAERIIADDDAIDALHARIFELTLSPEYEGDRKELINITLANRFFERFADHAVRVAEKIEYLGTGEWNQTA